ncbi:transcription regulator HTH, apses-type DNA-binding domain-containing protein, partial [Cercophora newfieldiana]
PRVVATLWEDEGTLLFTVQLNGVSVTRREDNHMVNASALLKAAGWSTERAEGRLEGEEVRHVVEGACSEYLDGVWVPFSEAMDIANEAGVVEGLYPLFVYNLGALL